MFRLSFLATFLATFLLLLPGVGHAAPRPFWPVPPLSQFDGARWGDLRLGETTFKQIQARYETGKGAYAQSTQLSQPKTVPLRVDLLWQKRGADEVLSAITVRFSQVPRRAEIERLYAGRDEVALEAAPEDLPEIWPPPVPEMVPDAETGPQNDSQNGEIPLNQAPFETVEAPASRVPEFFWPGRSQDWSVAHFASRGVAMFSLRENGVETAPLLLLSRPENLQLIPQRLSSEWQPVEMPIDPHQNDPRVMEFGQISISLDDDLELSPRERDRTKDLVREAYADGTIRYRRGASGTYRINMTGSKKRDKGSVSVSVAIEGTGPYGALSSSGSGSDTWKFSVQDDDRDHAYRVVDAYRDALRDAMREAETRFARAMNASGPPPLSALREAQWTQIIEDVRAQDGRVFEPRNSQLDGILR